MSDPAASPLPRKRIVYLTESFTMGGVERSTTLLIQHLDRTQYDPILFCSDEPDITRMVQEVESLGVPVVRTPHLSLRRPSSLLSQIGGLRRLLQQYQPDVLHIQVLGGTGGRQAALAGWLAGIPVIIKTIRGATRERLPWLMRRMMGVLDRSVTCYTTASENNRQLQIEHAGRLPDKVKRIYNAIDIAPYLVNSDVEAARLQLSLPLHGPVIGTVARLASQKGIEYFLEMAEYVHARIPEAHFLIVGEGDDRAQYEAFVASHRMQRYVTFTGYRSDIARCLDAMDVFVLASIFEPFGLALTEAMASQLPIVATHVGGIPEVLEDGVSGTLVPAQDGAALAEAVLRYLRQPTLACRHAKAARDRVQQCFSMERLIHEMQSLYATSPKQTTDRRFRFLSRRVKSPSWGGPSGASLCRPGRP